MKGLILFLALTPVFSTAEAASLTDQFDSYVEAYFLAEGKLADFDEELSEAVNSGKNHFLARSKIYPQLTALRIILEKDGNSFSRTLLSLGESDPVRKAFLSKLDSLGPVERLAAHDLLREARSKTRALPLFYSNLSEELIARKSARHLIATRVAEARKNAALVSRARELAGTLDFSARHSAPSALKIQPGTGPNGNINGSTFPAGTWALTFDDGPHAIHTPAIFKHLQSFQAKASFLWLVECMEKNPSLAEKALSLGYSLNNHSWTHPNLDNATPEVQRKEISDSTVALTDIYGKKPSFFRLPYGAGLSNQNARRLIADNGMIHVFWNVDSLDWKDKDPASILARIRKQMGLEKRGIILAHDIHPQTVETTKLLLEHTQSLPTHRWITLPAIVDELNQEAP